MKNLGRKYYNERITTRGNSNVQCHDQKESILNSMVIVNTGFPTLTTDDEKIKKSIQ